MTEPPATNATETARAQFGQSHAQQTPVSRRRRESHTGSSPQSTEVGAEEISSERQRMRRKRRRAKEEARGAWARHIALGLTICGIPLVLGGRSGGAIAVALIFALMGAAITYLTDGANHDGEDSTDDASRQTPRTQLVFGLIASIVLCVPLLQLIPVPAAWTDSGNQALRVAGLLGVAPPSFWPITRSPLATLTAVAKACTLVLVAYTVHRARLRTVLAFVVASALLVSVLGLLHSVARWPLYLGLWPFPLTSPFPHTLLNPNHLAALTTVGCVLAATLAITARAGPTQTAARMAWVFAATVLAGVLSMTASRGGVLGLGASVLVALSTSQAQRLSLVRKRGSRSSRTAERGFADDTQLSPAQWVLLVLAFLFVVVAIWGAGSALVQKLAAHDYSKLNLARLGWILALDHPWFGVGRGAFSESFVAIAGTNTRVEYPENWVVQAVSEYGLVFGLTWVAAIVYLVGHGFRRRRSAEAIGTLSAVAGLLVHDLFDFSLENIGVMSIFTALLCSVVTSERAMERGADHTPEAATPDVRAPLAFLTRKFEPTLVAAAALIGLALLATVFPRSGFRDARAHYEELEALLQVPDLNAFDQAFSRVALQFPSEPGLSVLRAKRAVLGEDEDAGRWLTVAQQMAPRWPSPHILAAAWLSKTGHLRQAWIELSVADRLQLGSSAEAGCRLLEQSTPEQAQLAGVAFTELPTNLETLLSNCHLEGNVELAANRLSMEHGYPPAVLRNAARLMQTDPMLALAQIRTVEGSEYRARRNELEIMALTARSEFALARQELARIPLTELSPALLVPAARVYSHFRQADNVEAIAGELTARCRGQIACVASVRKLLGDIALESGQTGRAFSEYEESVRIQLNAEALRAMVHLCDELGQPSRKARALSELCRIEPAAAECATTNS